MGSIITVTNSHDARLWWSWDDQLLINPSAHETSRVWSAHSSWRALRRGWWRPAGGQSLGIRRVGRGSAESLDASLVNRSQYAVAEALRFDFASPSWRSTLQLAGWPVHHFPRRLESARRESRRFWLKLFADKTGYAVGEVDFRSALSRRSE